MKILVSTIAAGLALAGAANATEIDFAHVVAPTTVPFSVGFTLPGFNTNLGTLTGIAVTLTNQSSAEVDIYNLTAGPMPFTNATASIPLTVSGPASLGLTATVVDGPIAGTANPGVTAHSGLYSVASASTTIDASEFASYEAPGGLSLSFTVSAPNGTYGGSSAPGLFFGGSAVSGGTVDVAYTYTAAAAPEPAAWALMFVGFGMMGGVLRRRSATAASI